MKGFSHFVSAIAAASFVPGVVELAAREGSLILVLAGASGLLPDWLDFKWARYVETPDVHLDPGSRPFDAQAVAERFAALIEQAATRDEPLQVQLHPVRLGAGRWQQYSLRVEARNSEVIVRRGPLLDTARRPLAPDPRSQAPVGRAKVAAPFNCSHDGEVRIDVFEGPTLEFARRQQPHGPDRLDISFLPWYRRWTHSLPLAALFGLAAGLLFGPLAGWAVAVGFATHALEDQLGYSGANLLWPFTSRRSAGLGLLRAGDPIPNYLAVWLSCALILFNLNRSAPTPQFDGGVWLLWTVAVPSLVMFSAHYYWSRERRRYRAVAERERELLKELEETTG